MIGLKRKRDASAFPSDFLGAKLQEKHIDLIDRYFTAHSSGVPIEFVSSKWKSAKSKLRADTAKKCAYCEASTSTVAHGDVEHFRPKATYWWLAYDFDNYLFSCQICNQIYKRDFFPVLNSQRLAAPAMPPALPGQQAGLKALAASLAVDAATATDDSVRQRWATEDGDLVNPYLEDPEAIFVYEADDSNEEVWIRPGTHAKSNRAYAASEQYLGINREDLRRDRYHHYSILALLKLVLDNGSVPISTQRRIEKEFARLALSKTPFAGMSRYFLRTWGLG